MDTLVRADIFFFVSTIAVLVLTVVLGVALFLLIQVLRDVRHVSRHIREESDHMLSDIADLREFIKKEGKKAIDMKDLVGGVVRFFSSKRRSPRRKEKK